MKNRSLKFYTLLTICCITLGGCGKSEERVEITTRDEVYLNLAEEADSYEEVYSLIKEYSEDKSEQEEFKKQIALLEGNEIVQEALLNAEDLSSEILITILENPRWKNPNQSELVSFLIDKIKNAKLSNEQELKIAKLPDQTAQLGLLYRDDICCEALCYIADEETTAIKNLDYYEYREQFYEHGTREWSEEEKEKLCETENKDILKGLIKPM